ncbi:SCO4226 family nickel-binding protein [Streptomyces sp. NPDC058646]|uniref:SCO4226 family nickel-binding protein n=1 Tax=Streptomyces sp. NPDC058646 TaxID=3346574 RepID=UPI003656D18C
MATFMDVHTGMQGITDEQLAAAHRADLAIEAEEGVHFERAWADPESGTVYCLSQGPSAEAVQRVHERTGHPADEIHPVPVSVS